MNKVRTIDLSGSRRGDSACRKARAQFSPYLDGALSGRDMARLSGHLEACTSCSTEFGEWRSVQQSLAALGPARPPEGLQTRLRSALRVERERSSYLSAPRRLLLAWREYLAPAALRVAGALAIAVALLGSLTWTYSPAMLVQANDDRMTHLVGPRYLYSQVPPTPIPARQDVPVLVDAKVDTSGRVYDYSILAGPTDPAVELRIEENLLASVFQPATAFGVPVRGHIMMTYTGVVVHG